MSDKQIVGWVWSYEDSDGIHFTSVDVSSDDTGQTLFRTAEDAKTVVETRIREDDATAELPKWRAVHERQWLCTVPGADYAVYPVYWGRP